LDTRTTQPRSSYFPPQRSKRSRNTAPIAERRDQQAPRYYYEGRIAQLGERHCISSAVTQNLPVLLSAPSRRSAHIPFLLFRGVRRNSESTKKTPPPQTHKVPTAGRGLTESYYYYGEEWKGEGRARPKKNLPAPPPLLLMTAFGLVSSRRAIYERPQIPPKKLNSATAGIRRLYYIISYFLHTGPTH
jgi:hypothetical protein